MKLIKIASILSMFGFLFVANAVSVDATSDNSINTNSTVIDLNDNATNSNSTMLDIPKGRSVISGDIDISKLPDEIHSVWIVDGGNWKGYSPHQIVIEEIKESYILLNENISARKATIVFAMEDTQLEIVIPSEPEDVTRLYGSGLSLHGANAQNFSAYDIVCSREGDALTASIKVMGDVPTVFAPQREVENYENFINIYENEGYFVLCEEAKEE